MMAIVKISDYQHLFRINASRLEQPENSTEHYLSDVIRPLIITFYAQMLIIVSLLMNTFWDQLCGFVLLSDIVCKIGLQSVLLRLEVEARLRRLLLLV